MSAVRHFLDAIKFEHTVFALPFAYVAMVLAADGWPGWHTVIWVTLAMAGARTVAMSVNRVADRFIDAANPRTARRHLPTGVLTPTQVTVATVLAGALLLLSAWMLNPLCLALSPLAVLFLVGYSYTKRFTWLTHWILGFTDGIACAGGWIAGAAAFDLDIGRAVLPAEFPDDDGRVGLERPADEGHHPLRGVRRLAQPLCDLHGLLQVLRGRRGLRKLARRFQILRREKGGLPGGILRVPAQGRHVGQVDGGPDQRSASQRSATGVDPAPGLVALVARGRAGRREVASRGPDAEQAQRDRVGRVEQLIRDAQARHDFAAPYAQALEARVLAADGRRDFFEIVVAVQQHHRELLVERHRAQRVQVEPGVRYFLGDEAGAILRPDAFPARQAGEPELAVAEEREPQSADALEHQQQPGRLDAELF
ncbi:MAG TPA: UbiA-like polyprenyltransferase, partial [Methylomirabilota bacterium]|nr:UbiA-like polyprenyltransferase [Methylomirabilota bacterium]